MEMRGRGKQACGSLLSDNVITMTLVCGQTADYKQISNVIANVSL